MPFADEAVNVGGDDGVDLADFLILHVLSDAFPRFYADAFDAAPPILFKAPFQDGFFVVEYDFGTFSNDANVSLASLVASIMNLRMPFLSRRFQP